MRLQLNMVRSELIFNLLAWPILPPTWASINYTIEELFFSIDDNSESQTLDKFGRNLMVDGIHPYNIAVTITHIQMGHFVAIRSRELIERSLKKEENLLSPLGKMLLSSQKITLWIITTILAITDLHTRSIVFSRFIEAAWILLIQFHNYNGTWLIVEGNKSHYN